MLSRVAENLYWMSRYVERAENVARLLDDGFQFELDAGLHSEESSHGPMDSILTILACREEFQRIYTEEMQPTLEADDEGAAAATAVLLPAVVLDSDAVLRFLTFDRRARCSILSMITQARENARATQEVLSAEAWSQVNRVYLYLSGPKAQKRFQ